MERMKRFWRYGLMGRKERKRLMARRLISTYLIMMLLMSGCADRYGRVLRPKDERIEIASTHSEFSMLANDSDLPAQYVSEGKVGITRVEAALEKADYSDTQARAELSRQLAEFHAYRSEMEAQVNRDLSEANAYREKYNKEYSKAMAEISAREVELVAVINQKDTIIGSLSKEGDSKRNDIISNAHEKFQRESARIEQLKEIHNAIEIESNAGILEMTEASKATRERASATVVELEAKARSVRLETQAGVDELEEEIKSVGVQARSESERLTVLREKAAKSEANLAGEEYELRLTEAASDKAEAEAKTQEKSANAPTRFERAMAEIDRLRAGIYHHQDSSVATYESDFAEIQARLDDELNEVKKLRVSADRAEEVARAEFVKVEAGARAEAARQTALHAEALAEAHKLQIIAEAEFEAARINRQVLDEIAAKKAAKRVHINKNTVVVSQQSEELHQVPGVPQVVPVAPRIEPDHIANYRSSFAEVMRVRAQANAHELVADATFAEAQTSLLAVKKQEDAIVFEKLAIADALESQARSRFAEIETKNEKELDVVESKYRQQIVEAESFRKEKQAEALDCQSQADALEQISGARAQKLLAEAESVATSGENDVKELKVTLWAVQQKGDAEYSKLMTEAKSVTNSQEALALQIDAQIDSAGRYLEAQLAKIDSAIKSGGRIAKADYQQALTQATVLRQKSQAEISRINAQFAMEHAVSKAQIERDRELAISQTLRGEATCDRMIASANTMKICEGAAFDAKNATAQADMNIILAANTANRSAAQVYLDAVKARFNARIHQVKAERVVAEAGEYKAMAIRRTDLASALAQAQAAREESIQKFAVLKKRQSELQRASLVNWSDKLASFNDNTEFEAVEVPTPQAVPPAVRPSWNINDRE